jgi:hypothetical protein
MIDATALERQCLRRCLRPFGEVAGEIGFDKPLSHFSEQEALRVITAIVGAYIEAMTLAHENGRTPCVRRVGQTHLRTDDGPGEA